MKILMLALLSLLMITSPLAQDSCLCTGQGDLDGSGSIDVADLTYAVAYFFLGGPAPLLDDACPAPNRGDLNCDNNVDIADLTALVAYMFLGGEPPCDLCAGGNTPPGDPFADPVWMQWFADNMEAAIYESGPSAFVYTNGFGLTQTDSMTGTDPTGDTTITTVRQMHFNDSAFILQVIPFPIKGGNVEPEKVGRSAVGDASNRFSSGSWVRFPPSECHQDGSVVSCTPLLVSGDRITFQGKEFNFGSPWPVGPPTLSDRALNVLRNPPPMLTNQQISQACFEALSVSNSRIVSIFKNVSWHVSTGQGLKEFQGLYHFLFTHSWVYECPDGPQKRELFMMFEYEEVTTLNGVETNRTSSKALYSHTYP